MTDRPSSSPRDPSLSPDPDPDPDLDKALNPAEGFDQEHGVGRTVAGPRQDESDLEPLGGGMTQPRERGDGLDTGDDHPQEGAAPEPPD